MKRLSTPFYLLAGLFQSLGFYSLAQAQTKLPAGTAEIVDRASILDTAVNEALKANAVRGQHEMALLRKVISAKISE